MLICCYNGIIIGVPNNPETLNRIISPDRLEMEGLMNRFNFLSELNFDQYPALVRDAVSLIEAHYAFLYGIDDLADQLQVTKHHLIRIFTANTGVSPGQYLIDVRIFHAKCLLQSGTETPLEIIAGACGYSCANYFSKAFKKHTGITPTEYIQSSKTDSPTLIDENIMNKFYL